MNDDAIFVAIADERRRLADLTSTFTDEQWSTPSLCEVWTCRDVVAHLVVPLVVSIPTFGLAMLRARGKFDRANIAMTTKVAADYPDLPTVLREKADKRFTPPGQGPLAPLTDVLVHGLDIRRPLDLTVDIEPDRARLVLDFLVENAGKNVFGTTPTTVRWVATDLEWAGGDGPVVEGPAESLMLVLSGRSAGTAELTGDGMAHLA